jgi:uncharacterized SAM-binding protein YcdF (DUF218 family)
MFSIGTLKPLLTALLLPPGGLLLLVFLAYLLSRWFQRLAWALVLTSASLMWVLSCDATAYGLNHWLLKSHAPVSAQAMKEAQAIVVLGAGVTPDAPEFSGEELTNEGYRRLAYAAWLAKRTHLPLLYAGGKSWTATAQTASEAEVAARTIERDFGLQIQWLDTASRDTRENALYAYELLSPLDKKRILLVTNDWHMQRSLRNFEQAGFTAAPAPMGYLQPPVHLPIDFMPSANGLRHSYWVLREWLGLLMT